MLSNANERPSIEGLFFVTRSCFIIVAEMRYIDDKLTFVENQHNFETQSKTKLSAMRNFNLKKGLLTAFTLLTGLTAFTQGVCTQYSYYYADITYPNGGEQTDLYNLELQGDDAIMSHIMTIDVGVHIAYNVTDGLIYAADDNTGDIRVIDPITGEVLSTKGVNQNVGKVTTASFNDEGFLLLGSHNGNIYQVDDLLSDPIEVSVYSEENDISGGDITFSGAGNLYLAAKPQGKFYEVIPGFANTLLGNVNGNVTGMATLENGTGVIVSSRNNGQFLTYEIDGGVTETASYNAILDGEAFTLGNGDMSSGCSQRSSSIDGCADFRTYYMEDAQGGGPDVLYSVSFNEMGGADLIALAEFGGGSHIGIGADGLIYIVRYGSGLLTTWDPETLAPVNEVQINVDGNNIGQIPAVVVGDDGFVYVGSQNGDIIYKVDPTTGAAEVFGEANVGGGDLVFVGDALWLANRGQGRFYEVNGSGQFDVAAEEINGVGILPDGNLLIANGNFNGLFEVYEPITGAATGEVFETGLELFNGDLATKCFDGNNANECENFELFLTANGGQGGDLYRVTLGDGSATLDLLLENLGDPHIAYDSSNGLLYIVKGQGEVAIYDPVSNVLSTFSDIVMGDMDISQTYAAVVTDEGTLLVGSANQNEVYEVDPATGAATNPVSVPVNGGDIIQTNDGNIWVIHRDQSRFYNITDGVSQFDVELDEMYGAAVMQSGMILVGDAGTQLRVVDPAIASVTETTYELGINITAGDLAGGCGDANPIITPENGECYATQVIEYIQGTRNNGGALSANRTDETQAIGEPEGIDQLVFVTLGYGGSISLTFDGVVPNLDGDDIQIIETSYGNPGCEAYPEYADVYVSPNGVDFFFAETVCKSDNGVDISAAGDFDYISVVKIVNNGNLTSTPDGYDLDGVIAVHNCDSDDTEENGEDEPTVNNQSAGSVGAESILVSYPNPTEGITTVEFMVSSDNKAIVEIFDMNGRLVESLFNQDVQAGNTYRVDFDGSSLPNGIYLVKYITDDETVIEKLMIAR